MFLSIDTLETLCFNYDNLKTLDDFKSKSKIVTEIAQVLEGMFYLEMLSGGIKEQ